MFPNCNTPASDNSCAKENNPSPKKTNKAFQVKEAEITG